MKHIIFFIIITLILNPSIANALSPLTHSLAHPQHTLTAQVIEPTDRAGITLVTPTLSLNPKP